MHSLGLPTQYICFQNVTGIIHKIYVFTCIVPYRAGTILYYMIVRPDSEDPNSSKMTYLTQIDMKGWIPHFVVNAFSKKSSEAWIDGLINYYWKDYSKKKGEEAKK